MLYFDALARRLHFGQAAAEVHVSQPALSTQIAELENRLDCKLVERTRGAVVLTDAGRRFLPAFRRILDEVRSIEEQARQVGGLLQGPLTLGMIPTLAPYLLPALAPEIGRRYPSLELRVRETITDTLIEQLQTGGIDAAIAALPITERWLGHIPLFTDRFFLVAGASDPVGRDAPLAPRGAGFDRLLLLEEGHCLRDQALALCDGGAASALVNFGATSLTTLLQMVANGMGRTLVPEIAIPAEAAERSDIRVVAFAAPAPQREIALLYRKGSHRQADFNVLAELCRTTAKSLLAQSRRMVARAS
ncbi:hydrogen peroxide-inducible genes activator [Pseudohoeflea coraliihabitans]|nr:hydrogen peroxide-inducible genes activator [Pseudohoeflea sp. DP4N28-3]